MGICSLDSYLKYMAHSRQRYKREKHSRSNRSGFYDALIIAFDLTWQRLSKDAQQILEILSFFNYSAVSIDVFLCNTQEQCLKRAIDKRISLSVILQSSLPFLKRLGLVIQQLFQVPTVQRLYQTPSILPELLRTSSADPSTAEERFQVVLRNLQIHSLIQLNEQAGMIWIHQVVWEYVKHKFDNYGREALACEAALTILTNCIELEETTLTNPTGYVDPRLLLPHVIQVRQRSQEILLGYQARQQSRNSLSSSITSFRWLALGSNKSDLPQLVKLSSIYFSGGEYQQARLLQEEARSFALLYWGTMLNPQCVHISFALALTYHRLYLFEKALELQRETIEASEIVFGKENDVTLSMTSILGLFFLSRGDLYESLQHSQEAVTGLEKLHQNEPQHRITLAALNHLGAVQGQYYRWNESGRLCDIAMRGLQEIDPEGNDTWFAKQNVAIAKINLGDANSSAEAEDLMADVHGHWRRTLGDEHPSTLLAAFNMSRVLFRRDKVQEAEDVLHPALELAESRLGSKDFGFMAGKVLLACIKLSQREYVQAEQILVDANDSYIEVTLSNDHFDRVVALWYLMECYKEQCKFDEALQVHEEIADAVKVTMNFNLRTKYPFAKNLSAKRQELEALKHGARIAIMRAVKANLD